MSAMQHSTFTEPCMQKAVKSFQADIRGGALYGELVIRDRHSADRQGEEVKGGCICSCTAARQSVPAANAMQ